MIPQPVLAAFFRAIAAVHVGAVASGCPADWKVPPLLPAFVTGAAVYWLGRRLSEEPSAKEVVVRGYLAPVVVVTAARVLFTNPPSWEAGAAEMRAVLTGAVSGTPLFVYLACAGYACLTFRPAKDAGVYR